MKCRDVSFMVGDDSLLEDSQETRLNTTPSKMSGREDGSHVAASVHRLNSDHG
jgi:hypothetical protein